MRSRRTCQRSRKGKKHVFENYLYGRVAQRKHARYLRAFLLQQPRHGGKSHQRRHQQKRRHDHVAEFKQFFAVSCKGFYAVIFKQRNHLAVQRAFDFFRVLFRHGLIAVGKGVEAVPVCKGDVYVGSAYKRLVHGVGQGGNNVLVGGNDVHRQIQHVLQQIHVLYGVGGVGHFRNVGVVVAGISRGDEVEGALDDTRHRHFRRLQHIQHGKRLVVRCRAVLLAYRHKNFLEIQRHLFAQRIAFYYLVGHLRPGVVAFKLAVARRHIRFVHLAVRLHELQPQRALFSHAYVQRRSRFHRSIGKKLTYFLYVLVGKALLRGAFNYVVAYVLRLIVVCKGVVYFVRRHAEA